MKTSHATKKRTRISPAMWAVIIFASAFLLRLVYLLGVQSSPLFTYLAPDSLLYYQIADNLATGQVVGDQILLKAPLYPYLLAAYDAVFGASLLGPLLLQSVLGALACALVYMLARKYYANRIAVTAGMAAACYGTFIFFGGELLPFTLALTLCLAALRLLVLYEDERKKSRLQIAGVLVGLSAAAHPAVLLFAPVVVLWIYQRLSKTGSEGWRQAKHFIVGLLIVLAIVALHNTLAGGELVVFKTYAGINFGAGNNALAQGGTPVLPSGKTDAGQGTEAATAFANLQTGKKLDATATGSYWLGQGISYIFSHPVSWIGLELRKLVGLVAAYEVPKDKQIYFFAERGGLLKFLLWDRLISFPLGLILPFAFLAPLAAAPLRKERRQCVLIGYVLAMVVVMLLFTVTARYRAMVIPIVLIWSAAGFWSLVQLYREGNFAKFYRMVLVLLAAIVVTNGISNIPGLFQKGKAEFDGHMFTGGAYYSAGKLDEAQQEFSEAANLNPRSVAPFLGLGNVYARMGKDSLAIDAIRRAIATDPTNDRPKRALAQIYHQKQKIKELNELVVAEIKRNPRAGWAYKEYGYVHEELKEYPIAAEQYELAFENDTTDYDAIFQKAGCYLAEDMRMEAAQEYQRFLKYVPNSVEGHANLAQVLARQGKFDQALQEFNWVAQAQPDSPASYFNLASINLQMRNLSRAEEMLNRASQIDPKFPGIEQLRNMIANQKRAGGK
jgi:tetratricopeptide (TPR) repeat protein